VTNRWINNSGNWYYYGPDGAMVTNRWQRDSSMQWFYLGTDGAMVTNCTKQDSSTNWFYLGSDGAMVANSWEDVSGTHFYFGSDGAMIISSWVQTDGKWYYLNSGGDMAFSTVTPDGYTVDENGVRINRSTSSHIRVSAVAITGDTKIGSVLTVGTLTPADAEVSYQWQMSSDGLIYTNIDGATANTYTIPKGSAGKYFRVSAKGINKYAGTVFSPAKQAERIVLTATAAANDKAYDGTTAATGTISLSGIVEGDEVSATGTFAFNGKDAGIGKTVTVTDITLSGEDVIDYTVGTTASTEADITSSDITVAAEQKTKVYGSADPDLTWTITAGFLVEGDELSGTLIREAGEDVGIYAIDQGTLSNSNSNYSITFEGADMEIVPAALTLSTPPLAESITYGDSLRNSAISGGTMMFGEMPMAGIFSFTYPDTMPSAGTYKADITFDPTSNNFGNYSLKVDVTVSPKPITVTINNQSKIYGDADPELTYAISTFLVGDDDFTGELARVAGEDVGSYEISKGTLALSSNYTMNFTDVKKYLQINKREVTITARDIQKIYGDTYYFTGNEFTSSVMVGTDSISSVSLSSDGAYSAAAPGTYEIMTFCVFPGIDTDMHNYSITYVPGTLTVNPALFAGHYYEYINDTGITWQEAEGAASQRYFNGWKGYLATITSLEENDFIASTCKGQGWLGGSDAGIEGDWIWVTGPEAGTQISTETRYIPDSFENWASGEPNNYIYNIDECENYLHMYGPADAKTGQWNDYNNSNPSIAGYIVEYGGIY